MTAPEVVRPGRARRVRLLAVVPLLVLLVALAVVLAGQRSATPGDALGEPSAHGAHAAPDADGDSGATPSGVADVPTADGAATAAAPAAPPEATSSPAEPAPAVAPPGSVPVPDPVTPAPGHPLDSSTGTALAQVAGAPVTTERVGAEALGEPRAPVDPADVLSSATALGGCHPAYGDAGQCLPLVPPSMAAHAADMLAAGLDLDSMPHPWTCSELLRSFPDGVAVRDVPAPGTSDPFGLDVDGDGIACATA